MLDFKVVDCGGVRVVEGLEGGGGFELIVVIEEVLNTEELSEEFDELFFVGMGGDGRGVWEGCLQEGGEFDESALWGSSGGVGESVEVVAIAFFYEDVDGVFVAEELDSVDGGFFEVTKGDDVAKGFGGVEDSVGAGVGLDEAVVGEVFVDK